MVAAGRPIQYSDDRVMHRDQFCAVLESGFDLDIRQHFRDAFHHVVTGQHLCAFMHELGNTLAIACAFKQCGADQGDRLWVIELQAPACRWLQMCQSQDRYRRQSWL